MPLDVSKRFLTGRPMAIDWFRKQSWSQEDQSGFWQRIAKARENSRAQYVFIQGFTLMEAGPNYRTDAIALFDHVIDRYPTSASFVRALSAKAECLLDSGDAEGALIYYDRAIKQMRIAPNNQTWAWLEFAWVVATKGLTNHFKSALDLLDEFGSSRQPFPVVAFRICGSRALIQSACGLTDSAKAAARTALDAADKAESGLRYHPKVGVVGSSYDDIRARLAAIVLNS
jgi:tetratricopeptide (TPR) repeat protein